MCGVLSSVRRGVSRPLTGAGRLLGQSRPLPLVLERETGGRLAADPCDVS